MGYQITQPEERQVGIQKRKQQRRKAADYLPYHDCACTTRHVSLYFVTTCILILAEAGVRAGAQRDGKKYVLSMGAESMDKPRASAGGNRSNPRPLLHTYIPVQVLSSKQERSRREDAAGAEKRRRSSRSCQCGGPKRGSALAFSGGAITTWYLYTSSGRQQAKAELGP